MIDPVDLRRSPPSQDLLHDGWGTALLVGGYAALGQVLDGQVGVAVGQTTSG